MGETPRGKKARYAEPADQTPDQKAEEIVKKTPGSNLEKTMFEDLTRVVSKFFKLTNRLIRTRERFQSLVRRGTVQNCGYCEVVVRESLRSSVSHRRVAHRPFRFTSISVLSNTSSSSSTDVSLHA